MAIEVMSAEEVAEARRLARKRRIFRELLEVDGRRKVHVCKRRRKLRDVRAGELRAARRNSR